MGMSLLTCLLAGASRKLVSFFKRQDFLYFRFCLSVRPLGLDFIINLNMLELSNPNSNLTVHNLHPKSPAHIYAIFLSNNPDWLIQTTWFFL